MKHKYPVLRNKPVSESGYGSGGKSVLAGNIRLMEENGIGAVPRG